MSVETLLLILRTNEHFKAGVLILLYDTSLFEVLGKSTTPSRKNAFMCIK